MFVLPEFNPTTGQTIGQTGTPGLNPALEARFAEYHAKNPQVYAALRRFALEAKHSGRTRLSINMLFERVRWETAISGVDDSFKMNNNYRAYYARLLMQQEPELSGFFETRLSKADSQP